MPKPQKIATKSRINLYLDTELSDWIASEAEKLGLNESAFARMLLIKAFDLQAKGK